MFMRFLSLDEVYKIKFYKNISIFHGANKYFYCVDGSGFNKMDKVIKCRRSNYRGIIDSFKKRAGKRLIIGRKWTVSS